MTGTTLAADSRSHGFLGRVAGLGLWLSVISAWLWAASATSAEMVIFADGDFLKVEAFEVDGNRVRLDLPSGGQMMISLRRVSRIVDDEVATPTAPEVPTTATWPLRFSEEQPRPEGRFADLIYEAAERHGLNPALVHAVVRAESSSQVDAVSVKGARGLMQLMPATAARFGLDPARSFEPKLNIDAGCRYLRWLADRFDDNLAHVLAAYNAGEGTVDRYGGIPPYRETQGYVRRIFGFLGLQLEPAG